MTRYARWAFPWLLGVAAVLLFTLVMARVGWADPSQAYFPLDTTTPGPDPSNFNQFFASVLDAIMHRNYWALAALGLIGFVGLARSAMPKIHGQLGAWLKTDRGGAVTVLVTATAGAAATTMLAWKKPSLELMLYTLIIAASGAGGWVLIKKIVWPSDLLPARIAVPPPLPPPPGPGE